MPKRHPIFRMTEQNPQIFEAFQTVENHFLFAICAFEMGGDLGGCPFAALGAEQVADGPKLLFQGFGEGLLFRGGDRTFGCGGDTCNKVLEPVSGLT
jgi:hypothetical protein